MKISAETLKRLIKEELFYREFHREGDELNETSIPPGASSHDKLLNALYDVLYNYWIDDAIPGHKSQFKQLGMGMQAEVVNDIMKSLPAIYNKYGVDDDGDEE